MRRLAIAVGFVSLLVVPAASAGGWATVVMAPPPAGLEADETWTANITVLRHGVTPTDGAAPSVTITGEEGSETFRAKATGAMGKYVAYVVFPAAGTWEYQVSDGLAATGYGVSQTHTYSLVEIVPGPGGGGGGVPAWPFALAAIALVAVGAMALARQRGSRPATQS